MLSDTSLSFAGCPKKNLPGIEERWENEKKNLWRYPKKSASMYKANLEANSAGKTDFLDKELRYIVVVVEVIVLFHMVNAK